MANNKPIDKSYLVKQLKNYETEIIDKKYVAKDSVATTLEAEVTDEQVTSALLAKTELEKKVDKTSIVTTLSSESTDEEVASAKSTYDGLQKAESDTKEQFGTASGEVISVDDSADGNVIDLSVEGKSFQQTYTGKNISPNIPNVATTVKNGITYSSNENGEFTIKGTATEDKVQ